MGHTPSPSCSGGQLVGTRPAPAVYCLAPVRVASAPSDPPTAFIISPLYTRPLRTILTRAEAISREEPQQGKHIPIKLTQQGSAL